MNRREKIVGVVLVVLSMTVPLFAIPPGRYVIFAPLYTEPIELALLIMQLADELEGRVPSTWNTPGTGLLVTNYELAASELLVGLAGKIHLDDLPRPNGTRLRLLGRRSLAPKTPTRRNKTT